MLSEGIRLARQRRAELVELIKSNPREALASAVPASARLQLPPDIAAELETRVSGIGNLSVLGVMPAIGGPAVQPIERFVRLDGRTYRAYVYGRRANQTSKSGIPLSGITIGDVLALAESAVRELEPGETPKPGNPVVDVRIPSTQSAAGLAPVLGEIGGKIYRFASSEQLWQAETRLEAAEGGINPTPVQSVAAVLGQDGAPPPTGGGPPSPAPPTPWTTGLKNVLVIRVDFSDLTGDPVGPNDTTPSSAIVTYTAPYVQNIADSRISPYYQKSSYGLTSLSNTVTTQVYRMPQTATSYAVGGLNDQLHADAEAAAAADYNVTNYDRIIVLFSNLGSIPGSLITYGGLALVGGKSVWSNGEFDFRVIAHELGHTYGLYHAGLWLVTDGNPISVTGTTVEYGDDFDTMGANYANDGNTDFSERNKNILGWLPDSKVLPITANGVYRIYAFDWANYLDATNAPYLALTLTKDSQRTYWIGARRNFTSNPTMEHGAYIVWGLATVGGASGGGFSSQLLDLNTPGNAPTAGVNSDYDAALTIGQTFIDPAIGFIIKPIAEGGTWPNSYIDLQVGGAAGGVDLRVATNYVSGGNGNGIIEFNECNELSLVLTNVGNKDATGVSATLSTTTPGAAIAQPASPYLNIPSGGSGANIVPFRISTSPSFVCGTPIDCSLLLQFDQGVINYRFSLPSGVPGKPFRFDSISTVPIPSPGSAKSAIVVSNIDFALSQVTVSLFVAEDFDSALNLELIGPDGTSCILSTNNGLLGQNYGVACNPDSQRTTFDDAATQPIASGVAPFVGSFMPSEQLAVFSGKSGTNVNGIWQLHATDQGQSDNAAIQCWSLYLTPTLCTDGGGQCPGADMAVGMTAQPNPVSAENNLTYSISVTNLGPSTATNVIVTHLFPATATFVSAFPSQGTYSEQGGLVTFSLGPLAARATATMTVVVIPTVAGVLFSTATVTSEQPDPNALNDSATVQVPVNPATADLAVGIAAAPSPVLIDSTLTYTVSLTNNGPIPAAAITVTNVLPASAPVLSATFSRGTPTYAGNVIFWSLPSLASGASATATIAVTPTAEGTLTATAAVSARELDPILANNTATVTTVVGPAADLALSLTGFPDPVVAGSNVTYTVAVTNQGPSTATGVIVNDLLPVNAAVLSNNTTQGTISISNNTLICALGTLTNGASAAITIVVGTTTNGTLTSTAAVAAQQADPNPADNAVTTTTTVAAPFVSIVPAGADLIMESGPTNGAIDLGETVTLVLSLRDAGNVGVQNLVATLLATSGVVPVPPNTPQTYDTLLPSGSKAGRPFSFTATGVNGGTVSAILQLQAGTNIYAPVSFTFTLPNTQTFVNTNTILIPDPAAPDPPWPFESGPASPYPSVINISNFSGLLGKVTVTLFDLNHTYPGDMNALLVAPGGAKTLLMSHAGELEVAGLILTFDDSAPSPLPASGVLNTGTWQPTAYSPEPRLGGFPANAPAGPYPAKLAAFNAVNANGAWSLYVFDDNSGDAGSISNGWSLALTTISAVNQIADLGLTAVATPNPALAGTILTNVFTITNAGPNTATFVSFTNVLPAGVTLVSSSPSQGSVITTPTNVIASLGTLNAGAIATVTEVVALTAVPIPPGLTNFTLATTANVGADETDLNPVNNTVTVLATVDRQVAKLRLAEAVAPDPVAVGFSLTNSVTLTNLGPGTALNAVLTQPLPPGVGFIAAGSSSTVGTLKAAAGAVICSLGNLASNATATVTIVLTNSTPGIMTNSVALLSDSYDPNPTDNVATTNITVVSPAPQIIGTGVVLAHESGPVNGAIDPGETVTLDLALANVGTLDTVNLQATLLPSGGVTSPSGPQFYGALVHGGPSAARSFTFVSASVPSGATVATLQLQDGTSNYPPITFTFASPAATNFSSSAAITIPYQGTATPYPATINVSGVTGRVNHAAVTLNGLAHTFPHDIDVVLVSPAGTNVLVMSHTGGGHAVTNINLTFDDDAASGTLPNFDPITSGTYKPSNYEGPVALPGTAPSKSYQYALSAFNWSNPNGAWSLYVYDDTAADSGIIASGWSLSLSNLVTVGPVMDLAVSMAVPAALNVGDALTNTITIANPGPDSATGVMLTNTLPVGVTFVSASLSQGNLTGTGGGHVTCSLGSLAAGGSATVIIVTVPSVTGSLINAVNVVGSEEDLNPANNSAQAKTSVSSPATLSGFFSDGQFHLTVTGQPNVVYVVQASTNLTSWVSLSTNTSPTGTFTFIDTTTPAPQQRFYRTLRP